MPSKANILDQALLMLGENIIQNVNEDTTAANTAAAFYDDARGFVLQDIKPSFARKRAAPPAGVTSAPPGHDGYTYTLPTDCLTVVAVIADHGYSPNYWTVEGRLLLTDYPVAYMLYIRNGEDLEAFMGGAFVQAFVSFLAHRMAMANVGSKDRANELLDNYVGLSDLARELEGVQGSAQYLTNTQLSAVR